MNPLEENSCNILKETLIKRTILSEQQRLQQLLSIEDLGYQKPTQVLCKMQQLLSEKVEAMDPSLFKGLFLQRFPSNIRMILASTAKKSNVQELVEMADRVMEVTTVATPQGLNLENLRLKWQA